MTNELSEAVAIAKLIGVDGRRIVGWVYRWNTGALAIRWAVHGPQLVSEMRPELSNSEKDEIDFASLMEPPQHDG